MKLETGTSSKSFSLLLVSFSTSLLSSCFCLTACPVASAQDMNFSSSSNWKITTEAEKKREEEEARKNPAAAAKLRPSGTTGPKAIRPQMKWTPVPVGSFGNSGKATGQKGAVLQAPPEMPAQSVQFSRSKSLNSLDPSSNEYKAVKLDHEAQALFEHGEFKKAYELMEMVVRLHPTGADGWYNKGLLAVRTGNATTAIADSEKAESLRPDMADKCGLAIAMASASGGDLAKAKSKLWDMKSKVRNNVSLEKKINSLLVDFADERAISDSTIVASVTDRDLIGAIQTLQKAGKTSSVVELCAQLERRGQNARNQSFVAYALAQSGKYPEALAAFKRADELAPSDPSNLIGIKVCATNTGNTDEVIYALKELIKRFPHDEKTKDWNDALAYYQRDFGETKIREAAKPDALVGGDVPHFAKRDMPLKVYVPDFNQATEGWTQPPATDTDFLAVVQKSFEDWVAATTNKVSFQTVNSVEDANISIEWVDDANKIGHSSVSGSTGIATNSKGQRRHALKLLVPTKNSSSNAEDFYETTVHEIGHSLGLSHSSDPSDIMYFSGLSGSNARHLSDNDKKRAFDLYK